MPERLRRSDDERLVHFARRVDEILAEPAMGQSFSWLIHLEGDQATTTYNEPRREDVRSLLIEVRKLDAPGEDLFLPGIIELLRTRVVDPDFQDGLAKARRDYDAFQGSGRFEYTDSEGEMTLRQAFEVWLYGGMLHDDLGKERRWARARLGQPFIRSNAVTYMRMLLAIASYCRRAIERDRGLVSIRTATRPGSPQS